MSSAVFRRAVEDDLRRRRRRDIADAYRAAHGSRAGLGREWEGWDEEGVWPGGNAPAKTDLGTN